MEVQSGRAARQVAIWWEIARPGGPQPPVLYRRPCFPSRGRVFHSGVATTVAGANRDTEYALESGWDGHPEGLPLAPAPIHRQAFRCELIQQKEAPTQLPPWGTCFQFARPMQSRWRYAYREKRGSRSTQVQLGADPRRVGRGQFLNGQRSRYSAQDLQRPRFAEWGPYRRGGGDCCVHLPIPEVHHALLRQT